MKLFLLCILVSNLVYASSVDVLSLNLEQAVEMALKTNDDLKMKKNDVLKSKYKSYETKGSLLPKIDFASKWTWNLDSPSPAEINEPSAALNPAAGSIKIANDYQLAHSVQATQLLFSFGQVYKSIKATEKAYAATMLQEEVSKFEVIYNVKLAYYSVLLAQKTLAIARTSYITAKENRDLLFKRFSAGRPPRNDNIKMSADVASRLPNLKNAESQYELAMLSLKMLIDVDYDRNIVLSDDYRKDFSSLDLNKLSDSMGQNEPTLKMLDQMIEVNSDLIAAKRASFLPTLVAFSSLTYMGSSVSEKTVGRDHMGTSLSVGLQLQFPIWQGWQTTNQYRQMLMDKTNSQILLRKTQRAFELDLKNAYTQYSGLLETYKANLQAYDLAKQSFEMSRSRFQTGQTSIAELNDAELLLTNSQLQTQMTLYNINKLMAKIEKLVAKEGVL